VLLRGLTREATHWGRFVPLLAQALPHDRILTLDLPGNGHLHAQASPWSVPAMAQACRQALAAQGVRGPVHLLAMSLGAMVATAWAHSAPEEVAGCVLINTSMRPFSPAHHRMQPQHWPTLARLLLWPHTPLQIETTVLRMTSNPPAAHAEVLPQWVLARQQRPVRAANVLRQLAAAARYRAPPTPLPVPTLLTCAAGSFILSGDWIVSVWIGVGLYSCVGILFFRRARVLEWAHNAWARLPQHHSGQ